LILILPLGVSGFAVGLDFTEIKGDQQKGQQSGQSRHFFLVGHDGRKQ